MRKNYIEKIKKKISKMCEKDIEFVSELIDLIQRVGYLENIVKEMSKLI